MENIIFSGQKNKKFGAVTILELIQEMNEFAIFTSEGRLNSKSKRIAQLKRRENDNNFSLEDFGITESYKTNSTKEGTTIYIISAISL